MANHKSSKKRIRQTVTKRAHNRLYHKTARNAVKALRNTSEKSAAEALLPKVTSMLDKLAKHNIIHKNKAGNERRAPTARQRALSRIGRDTPRKRKRESFHRKRFPLFIGGRVLLSVCLLPFGMSGGACRSERSGTGGNLLLERTFREFTEQRAMQARFRPCETPQSGLKYCGPLRRAG